MGETGWRIQGCSLYNLCKLLWLCNYFKVKSLKKSSIMVDFYMSWATIFLYLEVLWFLHRLQSKMPEVNEKVEVKGRPCPTTVHISGTSKPLAPQAPPHCLSVSAPMSSSQWRLPGPSCLKGKHYHPYCPIPTFLLCVFPVHLPAITYYIFYFFFFFFISAFVSSH